VVHARGNPREEAYHTPFSLHIAHGHVEIIIHSYIVDLWEKAGIKLSKSDAMEKRQHKLIAIC